MVPVKLLLLVWLQLAEGLGLRAPFGQVAAEQVQQLIDMGHSQVNESKIIEVARLSPAG